MSYFLKKEKEKASQWIQHIFIGYQLYASPFIKSEMRIIFQVFSQILLFGYLNSSLNGANVWALIATAVKVPGDKTKTQ
jgi:hypothetical protein